MMQSQDQQSLRVLLIHPGTQHAPRLAAELEKAGVLFRYWTGVGRPTRHRNLRNNLYKSEAEKRRRVVDIPKEKLRTIPWIEILALLCARLPINRERLWHWRNRLFQKMIPQSEIEAVDVVVGFDTAAWIIGERAKKAGKLFVLDQTVGHPLSRAKVVREAGLSEEVWPQAFVSRLQKVSEAERLEHEIADRVVVASSFSKKTLEENGVDERKICVMPYGVGEEFLEAGRKKFDRGQLDNLKREEKREFRFLYAGYFTERKGVELLLEAWRRMNTQGAELRFVGGGSPKEAAPDGVVFVGQATRQELLREMREADVFVFPSLFEGFALVLLEAMAAGLSVITTPNTAGPDLIQDGKQGIIVPVGNVDVLKTAMEFSRSNTERTFDMGRSAYETAKEYTWERYGDRWKAALQAMLS